MKRKQIINIALFALFLLEGCATSTKYNPFVGISRDEFRSSIKTIALTPFKISVQVNDPDSAKDFFEALIISELTQAGFNVLPSSTYAEIWNTFERNVGGYYDPITGKKDTSKYESVRKSCIAELVKKYKVDAILHQSIKKVSARFSNLGATWHGTTEDMYSFGEDLLMPLLGINSPQGTVGALSLLIVIEDINKKRLYSKFGGIQVLSKGEIHGFEAVPISNLLKDKEKNTKAVQISLDALVNKQHKI